MLLYYMYLDIADVSAVVEEQTHWCQELDLRGRIRVSDEGINGCLDGTRAGLEEYIRRMDNWDLLVQSGQKIHWKFHQYPVEDNNDELPNNNNNNTEIESAEAPRESKAKKEKRFRSLSVKHTKEVVSLDLDPDEIQKLKESKLTYLFDNIIEYMDSYVCYILSQFLLISLSILSRTWKISHSRRVPRNIIQPS